MSVLARCSVILKQTLNAIDRADLCRNKDTRRDECIKIEIEIEMEIEIEREMEIERQ